VTQTQIDVVVTANDADYNSKMSKAEKTAERTATAIGNQLKKSTAGARSVIEGVRGIGTVFGAVVGAAVGVARAIDSITTATERAAVAADQYQRTLDRIAETARIGSGASAAEVGQRQRSISEEINRATSDLATERGFSGYLQDGLNFISGQGGGQTRYERAAEAEGRLQLARQEQRRLAVLQERARAEDIRRRGVQLDAAVNAAELDRLSVADPEAAARMRAAMTRDDGFERARQVAGDDEATLIRIMDVVQDRYDAEIRALDEIAARKKEQEARELANERRRQAAVAQDVAFQLRLDEIERVRAAGDDKRADAMERRLDSERRISAIQRRDDLSEEQRQQLIRSERDTLAAREAAADQVTPTGPGGSFVVSGFANTAAVFSRVEAGLGGGGLAQQQLAIAQQQRNALTNIERSVGELINGGIVLEGR
jgi:hypothetical protein